VTGCRSKAELKARELHYMTIIPCININRPFVTDIQQIGGDRAEWQKAYSSSPVGKEVQNKYKKDHTTEIAEYRKQYQADHATELAEYQTAYRATPEGKEYQKEYQKAYNQTHKDKKNKQARERYAKNKEEAKREIQTQSPLTLTHSKEQTPSVWFCYATLETTPTEAYLVWKPF